MLESYSSTVILIAVVIYIGFMIFIYQKQILKIKNQVDSTDKLLPLCRTIVEIIKFSDDITPLLAPIEDTKFRYIWMTLYDLHGEVWADGRVPCYGKLPMPPSELQLKMFNQLQKEGVAAKDKNVDGVMFNTFTKCELSGTKSSKLVAAMKVPGKDLILCVQQCGENYV